MEPREKRRMVEKMAIYLKHKILVNIHTLPFRESTHLLRRVSQTPFHEIDHGYFRQAYSGYDDLVAKRSIWLREIGFPEACNYPPPSSPDQIARLNGIYNSRSKLERKAIESEAGFLKLLANPINPSWATFERHFEIYPASCFTSQRAYLDKRREWLALLGLNFWPLSYISVVDGYNDTAEVEWSEMTVEKRKIFDARAMKARALKILYSHRGLWWKKS